MGIVLILVTAFSVWKFVLPPGPRTAEKEIGLKLFGQTFKARETFFPAEPPFDRLAQSPPPQDECGENSELANVSRGKPVAYVPHTITTGDGNVLDQNAWYLSYSVNKGYFAQNLVDGDDNTLAYPASWVFDYVIDLGNIYDIKIVKLVWGGYGQSQDYITSWKLFGQETTGDDAGQIAEDSWTNVASGEFPNTSVTVINKNITTRWFRIIAASIDHKKRVLRNWIGMLELTACARRG